MISVQCPFSWFILELEAFGRLLKDDLVPQILFLSLSYFSTSPLPVFGVRSCVFHSFFPTPTLVFLFRFVIVLSGGVERAPSGLLFSYQGIHALICASLQCFFVYHITRRRAFAHFNLIKHQSSSPVHNWITLFHLWAHFTYRQHITLIFTPLFCWVFFFFLHKCVIWYINKGQRSSLCDWGVRGLCTWCDPSTQSHERECYCLLLASFTVNFSYFLFPDTSQ